MKRKIPEHNFDIVRLLRKVKWYEQIVVVEPLTRTKKGGARQVGEIQEGELSC
jgi:hypothetical protein